MNVFLVEDDNVLLLMLEQMITKMGFNVVGKAVSGVNAIDQINSIKPDLILMDIILKDHIDGITVADEVSKHHSFNIIYITGNSDPANKVRASQIGFHDYLIKPASYSELEDSIKRITNHS